ncbi:unnamed protein product [Coccothraustes coccothraustes]
MGPGPRTGRPPPGAQQRPAARPTTGRAPPPPHAAGKSVPRPDVPEPQRLWREDTHGRTDGHTHPPPPRPPPPGSPRLRHVPARPPPPAYLPRASPTPASRRSASPIGAQRAPPPAQPPILHFDWLISPPLNSRPASKHAPNGAALRGALSLVGGVAGSAG